MRLYIQQLEERVRQLTGQNEQLAYEVNQLRMQIGQGAAPGMQMQTGAINPQGLPPPGATQGAQGTGAHPQDLGSFSVPADDPLIAPDGAGDGSPVDLSVMAGGTPGIPANQNFRNQGFGAPPQDFGAAPQDFGAPAGGQVAALPGTPAPTAALSGSARDEYDLAYGYILTGDYGLAEQGFQSWLAAFPNDPQAADARFWLGESQYQQGEYREAANAFLNVYQTAQQSAKAPDALLKLGMSLAALGERQAACATLAEVPNKYPQAAPAVLSRVNDEAGRIGC